MVGSRRCGNAGNCNAGLGVLSVGVIGCDEQTEVLKSVRNPADSTPETGYGLGLLRRQSYKDYFECHAFFDLKKMKQM